MTDCFSSAINTVKEWVSIKSVKDKGYNDAPFGEGIKKMLNKALSDAESLGFKTINYDNYVGEVVFGEGDDLEGLAILCHLDVVPEGDLSKWKTNPYSCEEKDGYLIGRGVVDDKAPAVLCLYALKELKDLGFKPSKKIKLILGLDEESGWACIDHYKKVAVMPKTGFSPDAEFPVIYAEKGILHVEFLFDIGTKKISSLSGGERVNMVCDYASCTLKNGEEISFKGVSAHGSTPHLGDNAIKKLVDYLSKNDYIDKDIFVSLFDNDDVLLNIEDESGKLTFSPNVIDFKEGILSVKTDIRYPCTYKKEDIEKVISKLGKFNVLSHQAPIMSKKDGKLVKTLLDVYNKEFDRQDEPIAIGGGTYARALENGVAFGPALEGEDCCHVPNEKISVQKLKKCYNAYKKAIYELSK